MERDGGGVTWRADRQEREAAQLLRMTVEEWHSEDGLKKERAMVVLVRLREGLCIVSV